MRALFRAAPTFVLAAFCTASTYLAIENYPVAQAQIEPSPGEAVPPTTGPQEPSVTVLDHHDVQGVLGKEVRSAANENMGSIVDVIVYVWDEQRDRWRMLTFSEQQAIWELAAA